jgi:hypothetical protein
MLIVTLWVLVPCGLVVGYQHFRGTYSLPEDGGNKFLKNIGNHIQDHMASQTITPQSTFLLPSVPHS